MRSLFVILDRSVVGELIRTDGGEHRFSYVGARTAPISLSMPVDGGQFRHRVVDPFLEGLLPDQASVREALAARYGVLRPAEAHRPGLRRGRTLRRRRAPDAGPG